MRLTLVLSSVVVAGLGLAAFSSPAVAQDAANVPTISKRTFVSGSAKVKVTGSFQIDDEVAINVPASIADDGMTWLQYGASGSEPPNALITFQQDGFGINVSRGKRTAQAEPEHCKGKTEVTANLISGQYTCTGVVSYDAATRQMGKVNIEIRFTAKT